MCVKLSSVYINTESIRITLIFYVSIYQYLSIIIYLSVSINLCVYLSMCLSITLEHPLDTDR